MSYQTGSASSSTDVVKQLVTWLVSLGWTQDRSAVEGAGWTASLHHNGNFVHLRAVENESGVPWNAGFAAAHYFHQLHHVRRAEEMMADDVRGASARLRELIDI